MFSFINSSICVNSSVCVNYTKYTSVYKMHPPKTEYETH